MSEPDPVPVYTATPGPTDLDASSQTVSSEHDLDLPVTHFPRTRDSKGRSSESLQTEREIVRNFFTAVESKQSDVVATMIESRFVTPQTVDERGRTPLIAATAAEDVRMVQALVDFGAEVDAWGSFHGRQRTPLMVAAAKGNLMLVKLFVDVLHADDALIASDGQLALRLASEGGWREVVDFLPSRRGGGWRRWKTHHAVAVRRAKDAVRKIYHFARCLVWDVPKFFLWTLPKWLVLEPVKQALLWSWKHRSEFVPWCKRKAVEAAEKVTKVTAVCAKETWKFVTQKLPKFVARTLPRLCQDSVRFCWHALTVRIPAALRAFGLWGWKLSQDSVKFCWHALTVRIPAALKAFGQWVWEGAVAVCSSLSSLVLQIASFLHTVFSAMVSFFRSLTLKDIWNAFCDVLHAIFIAVPVQLWSWVQDFGKMSYNVMKALGGSVGEVFWWIGRILVWIVTYVPEQIWIVLSSLVGSVSKAWHEFLVWVNPKM
ncbi:MAG: hypothetical protein LQ351_004972 [Letrouitia transgressa]|nr:MAG: hypothetical protein LQ351_004972 [Letrouitia transgressa]